MMELYLGSRDYYVHQSLTILVFPNTVDCV